MDIDEEDIGWDPFLRVQVELDLTKPLAQGRSVVVNGNQLWIPLKYEKLPRFCFNCGRIVHISACNPLMAGGSRDQFEAWLQADPQRKSATKSSGDWRRWLENSTQPSPNMGTGETQGVREI